MFTDSAIPSRLAQLFRLVAACALAVVPAAAQTNVSGNITTDTTWDIAGSPYIMTNTVTVIGTDGPDGVTTLTIDPGVEVRVGNVNAQMAVGNFNTPGRLIADGDSGPGAPAQIVITSNQAAPAPGDWRRVIFDGESGGSVMRNVLVEYAGKNSFDGGAVDLSHGSGSITLDQLTVRDVNFDGILLNTGAFSLSNCTVENVTLYSIQIDNSSTIVGTVSNCNLESLLYNFGANSDVTWQSNTFTNWGAVTSRTGAAELGSIVSGNTFASKVPGAIIEVLANTNVELDSTWTPDGGAIRMLGSINVRGTDGADGVTTLTIAPGTRIELGSNTQLSVATASQPGALIADGDNGPGAPAEIVFTSASATPGPGDWKRVYFDRLTDTSSVLRNVRVEYAGQSATLDAGVYLFQNTGPITLDKLTVVESATSGVRIGGPVALSSCEVRETSEPGIRIDAIAGLSGSVTGCTLESFEYKGSQPVIDWQSNTFDNWGAVQSIAAPDAVASLTSGTNVYANPVPGARLKVLLGQILNDGSWGTPAGPVEMLGDLTIGGTDGPDDITTATFLPGLRVEFAFGARFSVGKSNFPTAPGELIADGNTGPGAPAAIVLTSASTNPAAGDWDGVHVVSTAGPGTRLRNVVIEYGGQGPFDAGLVLANSALSVPLQQLTVRESANDGIKYLNGGVDLTDSHISATDGYSISLGANTTVSGTVSNSTLESVLYDDADPAIVWDGNVFENWGATTSVVVATDFDFLSHNNTFNLVPDGVVEILNTTIGSDSSWAKAAGPIVSPGSQLVHGTDGPDGTTTLTLEPGVELRFGPGKEFFLGNGSTVPGRLVADGRTGPGTFESILLTSAEPVPATGDWDGIQVLEPGSVELYETVIKFADTAVQSSGEIAAIDGLTVVDSSTGVLVTSLGSTASTLNRMFFLNCGVGVIASNQFMTIRNSNLEGATFGVQNTSPAAFCVDAGDNWWGAASGPSGSAPAQGCELDNPVGSGSAVSEGVVFDNYMVAANDPGEPLNPGNLQGLRFLAGDTLTWGEAPHAVLYHIYRQPLADVGPGPFAVCRDDLDGNLTDLELIDADEPLVSEGFTYLVTGEDCLGAEGTLGVATAGERSNGNPCP